MSSSSRPPGPSGANDPTRSPPAAAEETEWQKQWESHRQTARALRRERPVWPSVWRGLRRCCPRCGTPGLVVAYLKPTPACSGCGEGFDHIRTDDFAPWLSILVIGHLLVPAVISVERLFDPPLWLHLVLWGTLGVEMVMAVLPRTKGAALGLMWSLGLRGDEHQY